MPQRGMPGGRGFGRRGLSDFEIAGGLRRREEEAEWFVKDISKPGSTSTSIIYGEKGAPLHGHIVQDGECEDVSYSRLPNSTVEYDDRG